jgi:Uma2 family endonuclease
MIATSTKLLALNKFLAMPETKPAREYIAGKVSQKPMPQGKHSLTRTKLITTISQLQGMIVFPELRCTFGDSSIVPDISVFQQAKVPTDEQGEIANIFDLAPDWIIEILSPEQSSTQVIKKILHCSRHGTEVGWLIDPAEKSIFIYHSGKQMEVVEQIDQELLVPVFAESVKLTAGEIFSWLKLS